MNTPNNNLDDILRKLDNFDPQVKPDWDAFLAGNKSRLTSLQNSSSSDAQGNIKTGATLRNLSIAVTLLIGIFTACYFIAEPNFDFFGNKTQNEQPGEYTSPAENAGNSDYTPVTPEIIEVIEHISPILNTDIETEEMLPIIIKATETNIKTTEIKKEIDNNPIPTGKPETSAADTVQDVIIKRTIIIKDTVRIKKEMKSNTR